MVKASGDVQAIFTPDVTDNSINSCVAYGSPVPGNNADEQRPDGYGQSECRIAKDALSLR